MAFLELLLCLAVVNAYQPQFNTHSKLNRNDGRSVPRFGRQPKPPPKVTPPVVRLSTPPPAPVIASQPVNAQSTPPNSGKGKDGSNKYADCLVPPVAEDLPEHGSWFDIPLPQPYGTYVKFQCDAGYTVVGWNAQTCYFGRWFGYLGTCELASTTNLISYINIDHSITLNYQVTAFIGQPLSGIINITAFETNDLQVNGSIDNLDGTGSVSFTLPYGNYTIHAEYEGNADYYGSSGVGSIMVAQGCINPPALTTSLKWVTVPDTITPHSDFLEVECTINTLIGSNQIQCWQGKWLGTLGTCGVPSSSKGIVKPPVVGGYGYGAPKKPCCTLS